MLDGEGLFVEIIAPRLWEDPRTIDGAFTSNNPGDRKYALERSKRCVDIAREIGCKNYVLWLAREGSYIREAKCAKTAVARIVDAWNAILEHDKEIRVLGEAKPNEPMDQAYLPTVGHMIGVAYKTVDPSRSGVLIESAHSILAGLDPADDMAYALYHDKLWSVHLNDQNGLKYDQDKVFGSVDLRRAFNQVWVLEKNGYGQNGESVGLDVKAMRTTTFEESTFHLAHSKTMFLRLLDVVRGVDRKKVEEFRSHRQYEQLEMLILNALMGARLDRTGGITEAKGPPSVTNLSLGDRDRRPHRHDPAAGVAPLRSQVDHPVGRGNDVELVLDHHDGMSQIGQSVENLEQALDVGKVQARRRLVEDDRAPGRSRPGPSSAASLIRWASPPESVLLDCPSVRYPSPRRGAHRALARLEARPRRARGSHRLASPAHRRSTFP